MDEEFVTIYMDYTPPRKIKRLILALARIGGILLQHEGAWKKYGDSTIC